MLNMWAHTNTKKKEERRLNYHQINGKVSYIVHALTWYWQRANGNAHNSLAKWSLTDTVAAAAASFPLQWPNPIKYTLHANEMMTKLLVVIANCMKFIYQQDWPTQSSIQYSQFWIFSRPYKISWALTVPFNLYIIYEFEYMCVSFVCVCMWYRIKIEESISVLQMFSRSYRV